MNIHLEIPTIQSFYSITYTFLVSKRRYGDMTTNKIGLTLINI
jgi:hypothetical protein